MEKHSYYDRDLSWLSFNYRVLMEARDTDVPLLERLRFVAIYSSNLDEFFRVRVASLRRLMAIGKKKINKKLDLNPYGVFQAVQAEVDRQQKEYGTLLNQLLKELKKEGIHIVQHIKQMVPGDRDQLNRYFRTRVLAFLRPRMLGSGAAPFLNNRALYFGVLLRKNDKTGFALLNIPSDQLPRFYMIRTSGSVRYYFLDDIIRLNIDRVFPDYDEIECYSLKLNKDADLQIEDEYNGDLVKKIEKQIKKRNLGDPARFLYDQLFPKDLLTAFVNTYALSADDLVSGARYHNLNDFFEIRNPVSEELEYEQWPPVPHRGLEAHLTIMSAMEASDQLLHIPYQSYDYVLQLFNEAAIDPDVKEINITLYRMAENSLIGGALMSAAANGKKVRVFMEVKARFDEENNLKWASRMRDAGIHIQYSMPGLKVHAKIALIRKMHNGKSRYYGFFSTGNMNESTAKIYCDYGLLTCHKGMTRELKEVFHFLYQQKPPGTTRHLIVSPFNAFERFGQLIDREINNKRAGKKARIAIKLNNLQEPNLVRKLYEAAAAGVEVRLLVRTVCCLVPDTYGIEVTRIVDRYLEHARIFSFHNNGKEDLFMGSSDWMNRNLHRRVEVTFPVYDPIVREQLLDILDMQWSDNAKRVRLNQELHNQPIQPAGVNRAQQAIYRYLQNLSAVPEHEKIHNF